MGAFVVSISGFSSNDNKFLVLTCPKGDKTAVVFAQHPHNKHGPSVVNSIERVAEEAFHSIAELNELRDKGLEYYTTFRYSVEVSDFRENRRGRVSKVEFGRGGKLRTGGLLSEKEWTFKGPDWVSEEPDADFVKRLDLEAWKAGFAAQVYHSQNGWSIPDIREEEEGDDEG